MSAQGNAVFEASGSGRSVLLVGNFLSANVGTRGMSEELGLRLKADGWEVLVASDKRGRLSRLVDMTTTAWRKRSLYSVAHVDVYSGAAFVWAEAACWILRRAGKPYMLSLRGGALPAFARRSPHRMRLMLGSAAAVTAPSQYLFDQLRSYREDITLLPNALNIDAYEFKLRQKARPLLVWLRAFHETYNPSLAPRVVAELVSDFPEARLTMIGPDKRDGSFQAVNQAVADLGLDNRITLVNGVPKPEVANWMNRGDIFLNTTNVDNTPVSVLEAMACGLCVVSTSVGGIPYLLEDERDALLVPPGSPDAMARAVRRILNDPELAARLSYNAYLKARKFDWSVVLPKWEALLKAVAGGSLREGPMLAHRTSSRSEL
jgi:glycosyltransferase involved in cell wall biosynthesis